MTAFQLDLFEPYDELKSVKIEIEELRIKQENVRKGLFSRHNDLAKLVVALTDKNDRLEARLNLLEKSLSR